MVSHKGRREKYRKKEKWLAFENIGHIYLIFHMQKLGKYICKNLQNLKFLQSNLWSGLYTDHDDDARRR